MAYFLKKKKKNPHDNIVFPKLTCMHAKMSSLQCNEYGSIWQNKATHNYSLLIIY